MDNKLLKIGDPLTVQTLTKELRFGTIVAFEERVIVLIDKTETFIAKKENHLLVNI